MKKNVFLLLSFLLSLGLFSQEAAITSLILVNADTNADIVEISAGMEINLQEYPGVAFSIRAIAEGDVKSVRLQLDGPVSGAMTENVAPYALFGDVSGNFNGKTFLPGAYVMQATPYNAANLGGVAGEELAINFSIIDEDVQRPFITTWKTDNPGDSPDNQITIPTFPGEIYDYSVDWGDGTSDLGVTGDITHIYQTPGTYQVSISGRFPRIQMGGSVDHQKIISIDQWGSIGWNSMAGAFTIAVNLEMKASDIPDLSNVTSLESMFGMCSSMSGNESFGLWDVSNIESMAGMFVHTNFNQNIGEWDVTNVRNMNNMFFQTPFNTDISSWDVSNVVDMGNMFRDAFRFNNDISDWDVSSVVEMEGMFQGASSFNQDISDWNTSKVTDMSTMFSNAVMFNQNLGGWDIANVSNMEIMFQAPGLSVENYDATLIGWSSQQLQNDVTFGGGNSQFCQGEAARQKLIDDFGWAITDGGKAEDCPEPRPFIFSLTKENSFFENITIPVNDGEIYNYMVDWGDGNIDTNITGPASHTYSQPNQEYRIEISGLFPRIYFGQLVPIEEFDATLTIYQWGDQKWSSFEDAFGLEETKIIILAEDAPDLTETTSLKGMFSNTFDVDGNASMHTWDVSTIEDMSFMFWRSVDTKADISSWDVSNVKNMSHMFAESRFNLDIRMWNVGNVIDMSAMFFADLNFNQDVSGWNTTKVTDMSNMFAAAISFDQDIGAWNTSSVIDMSNMFSNASIFNQDINGWDTSSVETMSGMFQLATSFDQNLGSWDIGNVSDFNFMLVQTRLSIENYDSLLQGWSSQQLQSGVTFDGGENQFCLAEEARQKLIDDFGWTITDGGKSEDCNLVEEGEADLISATYLQGFGNPEPTGPILRIEEGNRETYMKFDLSGFTGDITEAQLEMVVSSDPGNGTLEVFLGSNSNWTETGLNGSNKPSIVGEALASISGTHLLGQTKIWNLDAGQLSGGGEITLIVKHSNGNDVAFASDETANAPRLMITAGPTVPVDADGDGSFSDVDCNDDDDTIFPGAPELCDGKDNDCDGAIDEDLPTTSFYVDFDGDGFGDPLTETQLCDIRAGYVLDNTDCDDNNAAVYPGALEICDGIDNNCDGLIDDEDPNVTCDTPVEGEADLIEATYLQGAINPEPTGPILRIEEGNRETYMKFDLSGFTGDITEAQLEMVVSSDPGNGTLEVFLGSDSNWTETGLNGSNKPSIIGSTLASISGTHSLGQTKTWNLDVSQIPSGGLITLIVKHSNGNDVAFASDETANAPKLMISSVGAVTNSTNSLNLSPNPASDEIVVGFEIPIQVGAVFVYDVSGKLVQATPPGTAKSQGDFPMDVSGLPDGMYFIRTFDADGIPHQKTMVIDH